MVEIGEESYVEGDKLICKILKNKPDLIYFIAALHMPSLKRQLLCTGPK
jgi:hypothetical protein